MMISITTDRARMMHPARVQYNVVVSIGVSMALDLGRSLTETK